VSTPPTPLTGGTFGVVGVSFSLVPLEITRGTPQRVCLGWVFWVFGFYVLFFLGGRGGSADAGGRFGSFFLLWG